MGWAVSNEHQPADGPAAEKGTRLLLPAIISLALVVRVALAAAVGPSSSDVYYYLTQAVQALLGGTDPYGHAYLGIPPALLTPGAGHTLAYFPFTVLYLVPFYAAGDVRLGFVAADIAVGICIYLFGGKWKLQCAAAYLLLPFTVIFSTVLLNAALVGMVFVALFILLESGGRGLLGAASLGVALASSQFCVLLLPLASAYYVRKGRRREPLVALGSAAILVLPFLLASPSNFLSGTVSFEFERALVPLFSGGGPVGVLVNPSLGALVSSASGFSLPLYLRAVIVVVAMAVLLKADDLPTLSRNGAILVLVAVIVLPNDVFWAYFELPFMLLLFWLSSLKAAAPALNSRHRMLKTPEPRTATNGADGRAS